jgi:adenine specific DNA methylase Mod
MGEFAATNYNNAITRDNLLSMLYPRLQLAKQLLSDDGVIFCSIDDRNQAYIKCLFDEVFDERNFIADVIWHSKYTTSNDSNDISRQHEHVLVCAKNKLDFKMGLLERTDEMDAAYKNPDNDPKGKWKATPLHAKSGTENNLYEITFPNGKTWKAPKGRYPRYAKTRLLEIITVR